MVAITVILAAVIAAFVFNLGGSQVKAPTASIVAANNPDTSIIDMKVSHKGGDLLKAGEWKLSVVPINSPIDYVSSTSGSGDFAVGSQIAVSVDTVGCYNDLTVTHKTDPANTTCIVTNNGVTGMTGRNLTAGKYDVKLVHIPSSAMLVDTVIEVR